MHYFLSPVYPRTETDLFEKEEPQSIGTCYLANDYTLSTANFSSLWNQRRPFLAYWGEVKNPKYLQIRFLHDNYDFSSASFYGQQVENRILAGINFISNGGDKHISIDRLKEGKFVARDLRLRFEFGNTNLNDLAFPPAAFDPFTLKLDGLVFNFHLLTAKFSDLKGHWEKGEDGKTAWLDFVFYSGTEREFDLTKINKAIIGFTFTLNNLQNSQPYAKPEKLENDSVMKISWGGLKLQLPVNPESPKKWFL
jgi:hypothetical protein